MDISKKLVRLKVSDLIPYEKNPRKIPQEAINDVCESYRQCGVIDPIEIDEDNVILSGHTRRLAALEMGIDKVDCLRVQGLTDDQKRKYRVLANKTGERSTWDYDLLAAEIDELDFGDYDFDFEIPDIDEGFSKEDIKEDDYEPNVPDEPKAKRGDIYQLGDHRLMCGDSTDPEVIEQLMDGVKAELLLTDPPYGIDVVKGNKVGGGNIVKSKTYSAIIGDDTTDTARANYDVALTCTDNQIIFGGNYFTDFLPPSRCWIVWDKQNTGNFADAELAWTSFDKGVKLYHFLWNGLCREGSREVEGKTRVHPTQKPVGMLAEILKDF